MGIDEVGGARWMRRVGRYAAALMACVGAVACDEEDGCLDFRALRVDLGAESACEDCCVYPALRLQQLPSRLDNGVRVDVRRGNFIPLPNGDSAAVTELLYFLHDVRLEYADGRVVPLRDTFSFRQNDGLDFRLEDRSLLRAAPLQTARLETGELLEEGTVTAVLLSFGLPEDVLEADPLAQLNSSPLFLQRADTLLSTGSLAEGRRLRSAYLAVRRPDGLTDSTFVTSETFVAGAASVPYRLPLPEPLDLRRSFNVDLVLLLRMEPLLDLPAGAVSAQDFAEAYLGNASVLSAAASR